MGKSCQVRYAPTSNHDGKRAHTTNDGVKRSKIGQTCGVATPFGRNRICLRAFACGQRSCGSGRDAPIPPTLEVPPLICMTRGQQDVYGWWRKSSSRNKVLGPLKDCMQSLAQYCLLAVQAPQTTTLRVLSLSDGSVNESTTVPTSVLLSHAFASLGMNAWPLGLERVKIFGADVRNPGFQCVQSQTQSSQLPPWVELQHVHLDNEKNFKPQLYKFCQCRKFDVILMRQGLCYCQDHSFECLPPEELHLAGVQGEESSDGPSGTYVLEPYFTYGRPSYRKGSFLLHWRPDSHDWAVVEDNDQHYVWAKAVKDCGSPAVAQSPWYVWDGKDFVINKGISCELTGPTPWKRPPHACKCCAGISLHARAMQIFMGRVAAVLDEHQPKAFAFLLGGHYQGTRDEVDEFQLELERAAERFNSTNSRIRATILRKQEKEDGTTAPGCYNWCCMSGLLISPSLA